jgi:hypothetical protein
LLQKNISYKHALFGRRVASETLKGEARVILIVLQEQTGCGTGGNAWLEREKQFSRTESLG